MTKTWKVDPCPDAKGFLTIRPDDGSEHGDTDVQPVATVFYTDKAALIAAAPALLEALEELVADQDTMNEPYRNEAICERARVAIAKAKED